MKIAPFLGSLLLPALTACVVRPGLTVGHYHETRGPQTMMWTREELDILPNQAFAYTYSTDDEGGRIGEGTYEIHGRKLRLLFNGKPLVPVSYAQLRPLPTHPDSLLLTFAIYAMGSVGGRPGPCALASILVYDEAGHLQASAVSREDGYASLRVSKALHPHSIIIRSLMYQSLQQPWPSHSTAYTVYLQPNYGKVYAEGSTLQWRIVRHRANQLIIGRGRSRTQFIDVGAGLAPARR